MALEIVADFAACEDGAMEEKTTIAFSDAEWTSVRGCEYEKSWQM